MAYGFAELQGGGTRVRIVPALGGKLASLEALGREWLWEGGTGGGWGGDLPDGEAPAERTDGGAYAESGDPGGYDECFPTIAPCHIPTTVRRFGGVALPDHGELWAQRAAVTVETRSDGQRVTCTWEGRRLPYTFTRVTQVTGTGAVVMRYAVKNTGADPLPFIWSPRPTLPLTPATRIDLPVGARVRVWSFRGDALRGLAPEFRWPHARLERRIADLSQPDLVGRHFSCKLFLELPPGAGVVAVEEGPVRLEVEFDERSVPYVGLLLDKRERGAFSRGKPDHNLALEPCIGAPDSLADALGQWQAAHWVEPGETREWMLTWRAVPVGRRSVGA